VSSSFNIVTESLENSSLSAEVITVKVLVWIIAVQSPAAEDHA